MRLLWPLLISTSKAMSGREAIAYWMAVYKGEPVPELHTDYPTQKAIERRLQAVDAHPANKPRGGDDDLEEDDDSASKRTRGATGYAQGPGSAFITSSVRKSKGESSTSSSRYDRSAKRIATALDARGVARSAFSNPKS